MKRGKWPIELSAPEAGLLYPVNYDFALSPRQVAALFWRPERTTPAEVAEGTAIARGVGKLAKSMRTRERVSVPPSRFGVAPKRADETRAEYSRRYWRERRAIERANSEPKPRSPYGIEPRRPDETPKQYHARQERERRRALKEAA